MNKVKLFTTPTIDGVLIEKYYGIVTANQVAGTGFLTDFIASLSDVFGGNSGAYRESMNDLYRDVENQLIEKAENLGANAIIGTSINYDNISGKGMSMLMVSMQGTAVRIANIEADDCETTENGISWKNLKLANQIRKIKQKLNSNELLSDIEWNFLINNDVKNLTPSLYSNFQKCLEDSKYYATSGPNSMNGDTRFSPYQASIGVSYFRNYIAKLDYNEAIKYVYQNIEEFADIISTNKLFCASKILEIAKQGKLSIAISLLNVEKSSYNAQDLAEMKELTDYLRNLPDVGKKEEVKGGLFSSGGMKFICSCGTKNDISSEYCSECNKNIKGITNTEQQTINEFIELVETLSEILE